MEPAGAPISAVSPPQAHPVERAPLSPTERARLARQIAGLRHLDLRDRSYVLGEWSKGAFLKRVRDQGLWRRSPEHPAASFLDFVQAVTSLRSRGTVERRLLLVSSYSREEFLGYVGAGTCPTALCEIARAEEAVRPLLLRLARSGLTVGEVGMLRGAARALGKKAGPSADEQRERLEDRLLSLLSADRLGRRERRRRPRADENGRTAEERMSDGRAAEDGQALEGERARLREGESALAAQREEVARQQKTLEEQRAALFAEQEALAAEQARVDALARTPAAELAERETRLAAREGALAEREAQAEDLAGREAALLAREAGLADREAALAESEAGLGQQAEELAGERADIDFHRQRLAQEGERLAQMRAAVGRDRAQLLAWASENKRIKWPAPPRGMDETLLWLRDRLLEAQAIGELGRHLLDKKREIPQYGTIGRVFELKDLIQSVGAQLQGLVKDLATDVRRARPAEVEAYLRKQLEAERRGQGTQMEAATRPTAPRPPQDFARPTAAILGTAQPRSGQHGVLGFDARGELVTLDTAGVQTVALFGQQGAGKSHSILALAENALGTIPGVSLTPEPLAVIHCHYHGDADSYAPPYGGIL